MPIHAGSEPSKQRQLRQVRNKRSAVKGAQNEVLGIYIPAGVPIHAGSEPSNPRQVLFNFI